MPGLGIDDLPEKSNFNTNRITLLYYMTFISERFRKLRMAGRFTPEPGRYSPALSCMQNNVHPIDAYLLKAGSIKDETLETADTTFRELFSASSCLRLQKQLTRRTGS